MADFEFPVWSVRQVLDHRLLLAEGLGYHEVARLGCKKERVHDHLRRNLKRLIEATPLAALYRRQIGEAPTVERVEVMLDQSPDKGLWREPLTLHFPIVRWRHPSGTELAFVPALGIEVVANRETKLFKQLDAEIRMALERGRELTLSRLVACQRAARVEVERMIVPVTLQSAKARVLASERAEDRGPSVLSQVGANLRRAPDEPAFGLETIVAQLADLVNARQPRSVLLVGPSGVGKTATVRELVRKSAEFGLGDRPFWATSGARLVAGMSGYGMWQERCQKVVREAGRRKAILHLGNLVELMEVGKSEFNATGIAAFLRPYLARGEFLAIAECTPEQLPLIEREDPHFLAVFQVLNVPEPEGLAGREILEKVAARTTRQSSNAVSTSALDWIDRLHRRYATYSAYPGRPLRFLQNLCGDVREGVTEDNVLQAFQRETGLPKVLLDPAMPLDLVETGQWFGERVIGQEEAVDLIVDLLATTKAALARPRKPIASLLFIGPTGVGKTEMAKALAEFLFGSRLRLTRFDMSEFGDPVSAQRLVGGVFGSEGLLTAKIREQPFSVLLLDEFEKADPLFLDLLLQILGEGRLTDAGGRLADFSNAVVILTSNLGAESFQLGGFGFAKEGTIAQQTAARAHFERAVQAHLRPELFNRIDRLVPFAPLSAETIRLIAERHLERIRQRDGIRFRGVALRLGDNVAAHVARNGYDARYGARPLVREIERSLLAPLAESLNRFGADTALHADVELAADALKIDVKSRTDEHGKPLRVRPSDGLQANEAGRCMALRRQIQALEQGTAVKELANELFQLEKEQQRWEKLLLRYQRKLATLAGRDDERRRRFETAEPHARRQLQERLIKLAKLRNVSGRLRELAERCNDLESRLLIATYENRSENTKSSGDIQLLEEVFYDLLMVFYCRQLGAADQLTLTLFSEDPAFLRELATAYLTVAGRHEMTHESVAYGPPGWGLPTGDPRRFKNDLPEGADGESTDDPTKYSWLPYETDSGPYYRLVMTRGDRKRELLTLKVIKDIWPFLGSPWTQVIGLGFPLRGAAAALRFMPEAGLHSLRSQGKPECKCLVETHAEASLFVFPPTGIARRGAIGTQNRRRLYDRVHRAVDDVRLEGNLSWQSGSLVDALDEATEKCMQRSLLSLLEE
jgi:ATP-dependent Clp protease ATP-binding subunit ClpA